MINLKAVNPTEQRTLTYLEQNASEVLSQKINTGKKTLAGALNYAKEEARKLAKGEGCICVDDATVFGWIMHFFEEDHIKEAVKKASTRLPGGVKQKQAKVQQKPQAKIKSKPQMQQLSMIEALLGSEVTK